MEVGVGRLCPCRARSTGRREQLRPDNIPRKTSLSVGVLKGLRQPQPHPPSPQHRQLLASPPLARTRFLTALSPPRTQAPPAAARAVERRGSRCSAGRGAPVRLWLDVQAATTSSVRWDWGSLAGHRLRRLAHELWRGPDQRRLHLKLPALVPRPARRPHRLQCLGRSTCHLLRVRAARLDPVHSRGPLTGTPIHTSPLPRYGFLSNITLCFVVCPATASTSCTGAGRNPSMGGMVTR